MSRIMKIRGVWNTKQAVLSSVVFLGCLSGVGAEANTESSAAGAFNGLYGGASLGYVHQNTNIDAKQDPHDARADMHHSTTSRGVPVAEIFLGWGKVFGGCFYGGFEGKIDWVVKGAQKVAEDTGFIFKSGRKSPGVGFLARLGYLINPG